jgi:hypothetical protein
MYYLVVITTFASLGIINLPSSWQSDNNCCDGKRQRKNVAINHDTTNISPLIVKTRKRSTVIYHRRQQEHQRQSTWLDSKTRRQEDNISRCNQSQKKSNNIRPHKNNIQISPPQRRKTMRDIVASSSISTCREGR